VSSIFESTLVIAYLKVAGEWLASYAYSLWGRPWTTTLCPLIDAAQA
jgi:hypothetical protein